MRRYSITTYGFFKRILLWLFADRAYSYNSEEETVIYYYIYKDSVYVRRIEPLEEEQ